jgi:hypothetical protein
VKLAAARPDAAELCRGDERGPVETGQPAFGKIAQAAVNRRLAGFLAARLAKTHRASGP